MTPQSKMIQAYLLLNLKGERIMQNYTPREWWECDVFQLTKAGYFNEFEIKVSLSDLRNDCKKEHKIWGVNFVDKSNPQFVVNRVRNKHVCLREKDLKGPSMYWYVTPVGLVTPDEIPDWAGLMEVGYRFPGGPIIHTVVKSAPRLHREKFSDNRMNAVNQSAYGRYRYIIQSRSMKRLIKKDSLQ